MSAEPAYSRSSSPSLTAQVVLRARREGDRKRNSVRKPDGSPPTRFVATASTAFTPSRPPLASVDDDVDVILRWCCYCGYRVRTQLPACRFHSDLLVLDVGEARG